MLTTPELLVATITARSPVSYRPLDEEALRQRRWLLGLRMGDLLGLTLLVLPLVRLRGRARVPAWFGYACTLAVLASLRLSDVLFMQSRPPFAPLLAHGLCTLPAALALRWAFRSWRLEPEEAEPRVVAAGMRAAEAKPV